MWQERREREADFSQGGEGQRSGRYGVVEVKAGDFCGFPSLDNIGTPRVCGGGLWASAIYVSLSQRLGRNPHVGCGRLGRQINVY